MLRKLLIAISAYLSVQILRSSYYIHLGHRIAAQAQPYTRSKDSPGLNILFIGDSTAVGVGASVPEESIAGLIAQRFPTANIENKGISGSKVKSLLPIVSNLKSSHDLIMIHIGGNDTVRFTNIAELEQDLTTVIRLAQKHARYILITSTGNAGTVRLFPWFMRGLMKKRTLAVREVFLNVITAAGNNVRYTDMFLEPKFDPFAYSAQTYYAADKFHPSSTGYASWMPLIEAELQHFKL